MAEERVFRRRVTLRTALGRVRGCFVAADEDLRVALRVLVDEAARDDVRRLGVEAPRAVADWRPFRRPVVVVFFFAIAAQ